MIQSKLVSVGHLKETLIVGNTYSLVYSETIVGGNHIEELYNGQNVFLDHAVSSAAWEKEHRECLLGLYITIGLALIALILIDRLWCKGEYSKIHKLRLDIEKRKARMAQK